MSGPLSDVIDLQTLEQRYPGVKQIIEIWFANYKGPDRIVSGGFADADAAMEVAREASRYFEANSAGGE